ncbi:hypothetical protein BD410DRAFT_451408 [Rickenella mellea]|uniref:Uncharacterized protein n=1 Tax=Rickenella mellea TaxID=50990 RepID=A0A4Y7PVM5_9AGAM|nr:hypothetical protein BD410DRAFT_451408 [Rickenella mellea]
MKRDPALKEKGILHERGRKPEQVCLTRCIFFVRSDYACPSTTSHHPRSFRPLHYGVQISRTDFSFNNEQEQYHGESNPFERAKDDISESHDKYRVKAEVNGDKAKAGRRCEWCGWWRSKEPGATNWYLWVLFSCDKSWLCPRMNSMC